VEGGDRRVSGRDRRCENNAGGARGCGGGNVGEGSQGVKCKLMNCSRNWCGSLFTISPLYWCNVYTESLTTDAHGAYNNNNNNNINQYYSKYYFCHTHNISVGTYTTPANCGVFRFLSTPPPAIQCKTHEQFYF